MHTSCAHYKTKVSLLYNAGVTWKDWAFSIGCGSIVAAILGYGYWFIGATFGWLPYLAFIALVMAGVQFSIHHGKKHPSAADLASRRVSEKAAALLAQESALRTDLPASRLSALEHQSGTDPDTEPSRE
jgi:hypothetical protein